MYYNKDVGDFLGNVTVDGESFDPASFLHGNCHTFAIALAEKLKCRVGLWTEYDEDMECEVLVHAFAIETVNGITSYIDVRGRFYEFYDIVDGFDYIEEPTFVELSIKDAILKLKKLNIEESETEVAQWLVEAYFSKYKV